MLSGYSLGAFLNILTPDPPQWERDFRRLTRLPSLGHVELWVEHLPAEREQKLLRALLEGMDVLVHAPFIHLSLATNLKAIRRISKERYEEAIGFAARIDAKVVTMHGGSYAFYETKEVALERVAEMLDDLTSLDTPIVTVENMPAKRGTTQEALSSLRDLVSLKSLVPGIKFTLDVGHCLQNDEDFTSFLRRYKKSVLDIHMHDAVRGGRGHLPAGAGALDFGRLSQFLHEIAFDRYLTVENLTFEDTTATWSAWRAAESRTRDVIGSGT